jgi:hypothetical protein
MLTDCLRELLALGVTNVETVMRKCFEDAGLQTDRLSQALAAKINTQHQAMLVLHSDHHKALTSKLNNNQRDLLSNQVKHDRNLSATRRTQVDILHRQEKSMKVATRTQHETSRILRSMNRASTRADQATTKNIVVLNDLAADFKQLVSLNDGSLLLKQSCRDISFLGEHQDRIMAYLLPFQDDLDFAIDVLISQHGHAISISDAEFLRSELQHLVDSATQEKALQHPNSTAKSFDQWSYPGNAVGFLKNSLKDRKARGSLRSSNSHEKSSAKHIARPENRWKQSSQTYTIHTYSGPVHITIPRSRAAGEDPQDTTEVGISYTVTQNRSSVQVNAHFLRHLAYAGEARICAQLNVFTLVEESVSSRYMSLFENLSLAELDSALRRGTISSFHIDGSGNNLCLYVSSVRVLLR